MSLVDRILGRPVPDPLAWDAGAPAGRAGASAQDREAHQARLRRRELARRMWVDDAGHLTLAPYDAELCPDTKAPCAAPALAGPRALEEVFDTPTPRRLTAYRFDEDERYRAHLTEAHALWLAAALRHDGCACATVEVVRGEARIGFTAPRVLEALLPESVWEAMPETPADAFGHASLVAGALSGTLPWDALIAPGALAADVRVRVVARALPAAWLIHESARLAAGACALERRHATRTEGETARRIEDPGARAQQALIEDARARLADAGEMVLASITIEAAEAADLAWVRALASAALAPASGGHLAPVPVSVDLVRATPGAPRARTGTAAGDLGFTVPPAHRHDLLAVPVPLRDAARLCAPPTLPAPGIAVANASIAPAARRAFAVRDARPAPPAPDHIVLGSLAAGGALAVPRERFAQGVLITGQPGMRKTTCAAGLLRQLMVHGVRVCVLEPCKSEYPDLLQGAAPFVVQGRGAHRAPIRVNPFEVDAGVTPAQWIESLAACLVSAYGLTEQPLPLHLTALIRRLYRVHGIDLDRPAPRDARWPCAADLLAEIDPYIREEVCAGPEVTANIRGALTARARSMCAARELSAEHGLVARDLVARSRVLTLCDAGEETGALVGMLLVARLLATARLRGRRPLELVVAVEEAHVLLVDSITGEHTRFARLYERCLAELRASGIGFMTVEQRPSLIPAGVAANAVTRIAFASAHGADREAVGRALGLTEYQQRRLSSLEPGHAVVATASSAGADEIDTAAAWEQGRHAR